MRLTISMTMIASVALGCADTGLTKCAMTGECLPGYACENGFCAPRTDPVATGNCGPLGCTLDGPDDTRVVIPAGALTEMVTVDFERASAAILLPGLIQRSRVYRISIAHRPTAGLLGDAVVSIPLVGEEPTEADSPGVWRADAADMPWARLAGTLGQGVVSGESAVLGLFAAAQRPLVSDVGVPDSGVMLPDVSLLDQGFAPDAVDAADAAPDVPDVTPPDMGPEGPPDSGANEMPEAGRPDSGAGSEEDGGLSDSGGGMTGMDAETDPDSGSAEPDTAVIADSGTQVGEDIERPDSGGAKDLDGAAPPDSGTALADAEPPADSGSTVTEDGATATDSGAGTTDGGPDSGGQLEDGGS